MTPDRETGEWTAEERNILNRLQFRPVAGFTAPDRIAAAVALAERGLVRVWWGEGRDRGVLLCARAAPPGPPPRGPHLGTAA